MTPASRRVFKVGERVGVWYIDSEAFWTGHVTEVLQTMYRVRDEYDETVALVAADRVFDLGAMRAVF